MPVVHFHVVEPTPEQVERLLVEGSHLYADCLESPVDRVRVFVVRYDRSSVAAGGMAGVAAPFFTALLLRGRPAAQQQELAVRFTELLADVLSVDRALVRGHLVQVDPADWFIAGQSAATVRAAEIRARHEASGD